MWGCIASVTSGIAASKFALCQLGARANNLGTFALSSCRARLIKESATPRSVARLPSSNAYVRVGHKQTLCWVPRQVSFGRTSGRFELLLDLSLLPIPPRWKPKLPAFPSIVKGHEPMLSLAHDMTGLCSTQSVRFRLSPFSGDLDGQDTVSTGASDDEVRECFGSC